MFKMVTRILGVIALTGWMGAANATLIFDFSWDSDNGEIIGEIYGLSDNGENLTATGIVLTSIDAMQVKINVIDDPFWTVFRNNFDVANGIISGYEFDSRRVSPAYVTLYGAFRLSGVYSADNYFDDEYTIFRRGVVAFNNRVTVPEPSSVILMLLGLAGLSFARYRKQY
jgi:hypothetical protein